MLDCVVFFGELEALQLSLETWVGELRKLFEGLLRCSRRLLFRREVAPSYSAIVTGYCNLSAVRRCVVRASCGRLGGIGTGKAEVLACELR